MYTENAARKDLSAYETGAMFGNWLKEAIFANQSELGDAVSLSQGTVAKYLAVAHLPGVVVDAFGDPRVISLRWSEQLAAALKARGSAVLEQAQRLAADRAAPVAGGGPAQPAGSRAEPGHGGPGRCAPRPSSCAAGRSTRSRRVAMASRFPSAASSIPKIAKAAQEEVKDALTRFLAKRLKEEGE